MSRDKTGPIIQIDRLIFDTRDKIKPNSIIQNEEKSSKESYIFFPSNKLKVIRLTMDDLNKNINNEEQKIYVMGQQSSKVEKTNDETILSPMYESIDGRRDSFDLMKKRFSNIS